jgi:hypothetical protein
MRMLFQILNQFSNTGDGEVCNIVINFESECKSMMI